MTMKKTAAVLVGLSMLLPVMAQADIVQLQSSAGSSASAATGPIACYDFSQTLKMGSKGNEVRALQSALIREGWTILASEYGMFGASTQTAVLAFQGKYASMILPDGSAPTGLVGRNTRAQLNAIYGCDRQMVNAMPMTGSMSSGSGLVSLKVQNIALDQRGVTGTFCNNSNAAIPVFPVRLRLNGINRDFSVTNATNAGACETQTVPYSAWGLSYDSGSTYGVTAILDPNATYKTSTVSYLSAGTTTIVVPAVSGFQLAVRGVTLKSSGLQGTFCNLGTQDVVNFPAQVTLNGISQMLDVTTAHVHGTCGTITWPYSTWSFAGQPGSQASVSVNIDPNNIYGDTNRLDNSASLVGTI